MTQKYIFGAGIQGQAFFKVFNKLEIGLSGFIDSFSDKKNYNGLPVYRPQDIKDKTAEIYVSVGLISKKIKADLLKAGFQNVFDYTESVLKYPDIIHALKIYSLWYSNSVDEMVNQAELANFRKLLVDEKSRCLLDRIIRFRTNFKAEDYVIPEEKTQYFPDDIPVFSSLDNIRFIDAGAYTGDTITSLQSACKNKVVNFEHAACFEPDVANLTALKATANKLQQDNDNCKFFIYPSGVWSHSQILTFNAGKATSSNITENQDRIDLSQSISGVSIDDCVFNTKPNFIKMDVEGAEQQALIGATKTIQEYTPVLTICLYHKPADLWEIPHLIHNINDGYDMYLRVYGDMLLETVLYCLPKGTKQ